MSGFYDEDGRHICEWCGKLTKYQIMSGGKEFWCPHCETNGNYPEGEGGPIGRMFAEPDGALKVRRYMYDEIARRKENQ